MRDTDLTVTREKLTSALAKVDVLEGSILKGIKEYYKNDLSSFVEKINEIRVFMNMTDATKYLLDELNRTEFQSPPNRKKSTNRKISGNGQPVRIRNDYYKWLCLLNSLFNLPLHSLGADYNNLIVQRINKNERLKRQMEVIDLKKFDYDEHEDHRQELSNRYTKSLKKFLNLVKTDLLIYDYLERQNPRTEDYLKSNDVLFRDIEAKYSEAKRTGNPIVYKRFMTLPLRIRGTKPLHVDDRELKKLFLKFISVHLFEHICRCLMEFPEFEHPQMFSSFYILPNPLHTSHYAIINQGEARLTEYCRFDENLQCKPDVLYIDYDTKNSQYGDVAIKAVNEVNKLKRHARLLTIDGIPELLFELKQETEYKMEKSISDIDRLVYSDRIELINLKIKSWKSIQKSKD